MTRHSAAREMVVNRQRLGGDFACGPSSKQPPSRWPARPPPHFFSPRVRSRTPAVDRSLGRPWRSKPRMRMQPQPRRTQLSRFTSRTEDRWSTSRVLPLFRHARVRPYSPRVSARASSSTRTDASSQTTTLFKTLTNWPLPSRTRPPCPRSSSVATRTTIWR